MRPSDRDSHPITTRIGLPPIFDLCLFHQRSDGCISCIHFEHLTVEAQKLFYKEIKVLHAPKMLFMLHTILYLNFID